MVKIFIEGKGTEKEFLNYLISKQMGIASDFEIVTVGGKNGLSNAVNTFFQNTDNGGINLIIFDADSPTNGGGYAIRYEEITNEISQLGIQVGGVFLFPDNDTDGDFESLLEGLVPAEKNGILNCFETFELCLRELPFAESIRMPGRKRKMFVYKDVLVKKDDKTFAFENPDIWDFESPMVNRLKTFLQPYF